MSESNIESVLNESRLFPPSEEFKAQAHISGMDEYERLYAEADADPEAFWANQAESLHWFQKWDTVLEWNLPFAKWFVGGTTNVAYNCLDRHLTSWRRNKAAIIWEGEPGEKRVLTYHQLGPAPRGVRLKGLFVNARLFYRQLTELRAAGYRTACTTDHGVNTAAVLPFELRRITARYRSRSLRNLVAWFRERVACGGGNVAGV